MSVAVIDAKGALAEEEEPSDPVISSADLLSAIDGELQPLLAALRQCETGTVVAFTAWRPTGSVSLLPFHLHVRWPDRLPWLGLNASLAVVPFTAADFAMAAHPLHQVEEVRRARRTAKTQRYADKRDLPKDCVLSDWEIAVERDRDRFDDLVLPSAAFAWIHKVKANGDVIGVPRPTLGRHAKRDAPCSLVFVPGGREPSRRTIQTLAGTDLLIVDLQRVRGKRSLRTIQAVVAARPPTRPTLIVVTSPSDLLAAGFEEGLHLKATVVVGDSPQVASFDVVPVAQDRLAAETRFEASLPPVGLSPSSDRAITLAKAAWWAARQSVDVEGDERERRGFERALEALAREDPLTAGLFSACRDLLQFATADVSMRGERLTAAVRTVLHSPRRGPIAVLTRTAKDAVSLRRALAADLKILEGDLELLDVHVRTVRTPRPGPLDGTTVLVGYSGIAALDAVLAGGKTHTLAVFDPIEARVAWYHAQRMAEYLNLIGAATVAAPLRRIVESLAPNVAGFSDSRELSLDDTVRNGDIAHVARDDLHPDEALVSLINGVQLRVAIGARFEVLGRNGLGSRVKVVSSLLPGDQIVLLDDGAQAVFSERRIAALDEGVLKKESAARNAWLVLVRAVAEAKNLTAGAIARAMAADGHPVTVAAVNRWLAADPEEAHVPRLADRFLALARVLGIQLPEEVLLGYHRDIHAWRVRHRRAGREVAEAMRLAYAGRLGPASLARIEREWGVAVRTIIDAAEVGIVDEVLLPHEASP